MEKSVKIQLSFHPVDTEKPLVHTFAARFGKTPKEYRRQRR